MKVARHWVREKVTARSPEGDTEQATAWGWSALSLDEARTRARESARRLAQWLLETDRTEQPRSSQEYAYLCDRPPREEIIQEFHDANGQPAAVITRNSYGSLVLNARDLMFIDIDLPQPTAGATIGRLIGSLFGKRSATLQEVALQKIRDWSATHRDFTLRVYRTSAGYRAMIIDRPMNANSEVARRILAELDSDPLYRRLCEAQECFRARLTPKPWRIEVENPPGRFPFLDAKVKKHFRQWVNEYDRQQEQYATCHFVEQIGRDKPHDDLTPLVKLHDELTRCDSGLPLA